MRFQEQSTKAVDQIVGLLTIEGCNKQLKRTIREIILRNLSDLPETELKLREKVSESEIRLRQKGVIL